MDLALNNLQYLICHKNKPCSVMVKSIECKILVSEFELQSRYYVHFQTHTIGKGMNPLMLPAMG